MSEFICPVCGKFFEENSLKSDGYCSFECWEKDNCKDPIEYDYKSDEFLIKETI